MRLLELTDAGEICLTKNFFGKNIPKYVILSHTWGNEEEEISFKDLKDGTDKNKLGYDKIRFCGEQARRDGLRYFWVDTCCIDKSSSAELQEAINCMFRWYRDAAKCYVYLADISKPFLDPGDESGSQPRWKPAFRKSRWFTRGWTLQELIAPASVEFFSKEGVQLGNKRSLEESIHEITGIPLNALRGSPLSSFSVPERMAWIGGRETTREEDMVYSLLGIFDVHMPLLYGEGRDKAFRRLWKEIEGLLNNEPPPVHPHSESIFWLNGGTVTGMPDMAALPHTRSTSILSPGDFEGPMKPVSLAVAAPTNNSSAIAEFEVVIASEAAWPLARCNPPIYSGVCPRTAIVHLECLEQKSKQEGTWSAQERFLENPEDSTADVPQVVPLTSRSRDKMLAITQSFLHKALEIHRGGIYPNTGNHSPDNFNFELPPSRILEHFLCSYIHSLSTY